MSALIEAVEAVALADRWAQDGTALRLTEAFLVDEERAAGVARRALALAEAADSLVKASTPEPFSTSKTSNWVAKVGGLPNYIQHVAHGILRSGAKSVSDAIAKAIGVVKRWARGGGGVDANTKAAAQKAVAEWEEKKARSHAA